MTSRSTLSLALQIAKHDMAELPGTAARRFHNVLQRARAMAEESQLKLYTHVVAGHPVRDIIELAAELKVDLLVVGASGHSALYDQNHEENDADTEEDQGLRRERRE